jgi:hypothetical protein
MMKFEPHTTHMLKELDIESSTPIRAIHATISKKRNDHNIDSRSKPRLVLVRGLPGSGKSTLAKEFSKMGYRHFEADQYFVRNRMYCPDRTKFTEAHIWCLHLVTRTLDFGHSVVVSNTFPRVRDLSPYLKLTQSVLIVETAGVWENIHGITIEQIKQISNKWDSLLPHFLTSSGDEGIR